MYKYRRILTVMVFLVGCAIGVTISAFSARGRESAAVEPTPTPEIEAAVTADPSPAVIVTPEPECEPEPTMEVPQYSEQELEMLALVIYQEAGGDACADSTRQMVGEVVLNRVADSRYPDTIYEVITQKAQYGRLYWTGLVWPERANNPAEAHAIERAYDCAAALLTGAVERLLPEDAVFQAEFPQGKETVAHQNGLYFCR